MGGGTSGLYFGTKGSKREYQYSLFPDRIRKDSLECAEATVRAEFQHCDEADTSKKPLITLKMVLKKCTDYRNGLITAEQLVDWLFYVTRPSIFRMKQLLRNAIVSAVNSLFHCLHNIDILSFNRELDDFENKLNLLR